MDKLFGREQEKQRLDDLLHSGKAEFIAIYGRRRVGKTFLIKQYLKQQIKFYVSGVLDEDKYMQFQAFRDALESHGAQVPKSNSWMEMFKSLRKYLTASAGNGKPCVVFIDEMPCMDTPRSGFIAALDHFWNTWASDFDNIKLIVCGSATSWMINKLIDSHGGLHNRVTATLHLHPFTLLQTEDFLKSRKIRWNRSMITQSYMIFGGIPFYLSLITPKESLPQAIDRLYFDQDAALSNEYNRLMASPCRSPKPYNKIIEVLSTNRMGVSREQIANATGMKTGGNLTKLLTELEHCDFIRSYYTREKKVKLNDKMYQLTDMFTLFHLHFATKCSTDKMFWQHHQDQPMLNTWCGLAFEKVVLLHIEQVKKALGIDRIGVNYYAWRSKTSEPAAQIDLILDRADNLVNICEMKFARDEYVMTDEDEFRMRRRTSTFLRETRSRQGARPTMITPYGLMQNTHSSEITDQITLDGLFC